MSYAKINKHYRPAQKAANLIRTDIKAKTEAIKGGGWDDVGLIAIILLSCISLVLQGVSIGARLAGKDEREQ